MSGIVGSVTLRRRPKTFQEMGLSAPLYSAAVQKHFKKWDCRLRYTPPPSKNISRNGIVGSVALCRRPLRIELAQSLLTQPLVAFVFLCLIRLRKQAFDTLRHKKTPTFVEAL